MRSANGTALLGERGVGSRDAHPSAAQREAPGRDRRHLILLVLLAAIALGLRLYGLHWDQGGLYHPDERAVLDHVQRLAFPFRNLSSLWQPESTWNPAWFPYGSFPLYVLKTVSWTLSPWLEYPKHLASLGRVVSALCDVATVLLAYAVAARFFGRRAGLLAASFIALAVLHIQQSHFFVTDTMLAPLLMASFFFVSKGVTAPTAKSWALAGLFFGLALATKASAAPFVLVFLAGAWLSATQVPDKRGARERAFGLLLLACGVALVTFSVAQPYAFIDWKTYSHDVAQESQMVRRLVDFPYTRQYIDTPAYLYQIQQLGLWGLGLPLGALLWVGVAFAAFMGAARRAVPYVLLAAWVVPYFLIVGEFQVKFMRYMLPITPFMAVAAAGMVGSAWERRVQEGELDQGVLRRRKAVGWATGAAVAAVLFSTALYTAAYVNIYSRPHPATATVAWVLANVPKGETLLQDSNWEEGFRGLEPYRQFRTEVYDEDTSQKRQDLISSLVEADYLLFYSNRQYGTIPRLPERYPVTTDYYKELFGGTLGFQLVHWDASYPNLLGMSLADDTLRRPRLPTPTALAGYKQTPISFNLGFADESFTVYDHPVTLVFRKELPGSTEAQRQFFEQAVAQPEARASDPERLMMSAETAAAQQAGGTWSVLFDRGSIVNRIPFLFWYSLVQLAFLVTLPFTLVLFRRLPDRGYLLGKTLSFLLMAYIPWLLASLHILAFGPVSIVLGLAFLAVVSGGFLFIGYLEMWDFLKARRGMILAGEALFFVAFAAFYIVRTLNPDLWQADQWVSWVQQFGRGGEKPMDFAYFNAVVRSSYMPPYDPWFSGGYLNYYYFGMFMNAVPTKLLGIVPSKAIVLAVPMFFALTVTAAFSVAYNLAALVGERSRKGRLAQTGAGEAPIGTRVMAPVWAGLMAALMVAVMGNMDGLIQLLQGGLRVVSGEPFGYFDYWWSSRMMPSDLEGITEFPYFTFLFADPHAHLWVIPLTLLSLGLSLALVAGSAAPQRWVGRTAILPFLFLALTLGAILATNSWDALTYAAIGALAVLIAELTGDERPMLTALSRAVVKIGALGALALLFFLPYYLSYEAPLRENHTGLLAALPLVGRFVQIFNSTFQPSEIVTDLARYIGIHALFLFVVISFLAMELASQYKQATAAIPPLALAKTPPGTALSPSTIDLRLIRAIQLLGWRWLTYTALGVALVFNLIATGLVTVAFLTAILLVLGPLVRRAALADDDGKPVKLLVYAMVATALSLGIFVDLFTFTGDIGRLNTVFKFYLQVWVLLAVASAFALWQLRFGRAIASKPRRSIWAGALAFLVAAALIYPIMATPVRVKARFNLIPPTVDGMTYMNTAVYHDQDTPVELRWDKLGIEALQDMVEGSPVIVEGITPLYRWGNRVSVYTGLPAVIGWDHHQKQQRGDYAGYRSGVDERRQEVDAFFRTENQDDAASFLAKYNVRYIYVGELERVYYPAAGLAKFDAMMGSRLELAYQNQEVRIYRVI